VGRSALKKSEICVIKIIFKNSNLNRIMKVVVNYTLLFLVQESVTCGAEFEMSFGVHGAYTELNGDDDDDDDVDAAADDDDDDVCWLVA